MVEGQQGTCDGGRPATGNSADERCASREVIATPVSARLAWLMQPRISWPESAVALIRALRSGGAWVTSSAVTGVVKSLRNRSRRSAVAASIRVM